MSDKSRVRVRRPRLSDGAIDPDRVVLHAGEVTGAIAVRMPEPEVRDRMDVGAIHWNEQVEPGLPDAH